MQTAKQFLLHGALILCLFFQTGCRESVNYQVADKVVYENPVKSKHPKTDLQFISIVYSDVFGKTIPVSELNSIKNLFLSQGDEGFNHAGYAQYLLNKADSTLPSDKTMRAELCSFIKSTYLRFYNRTPTKYEEYLLESAIEKNKEMNVRAIYFAFLTSAEYEGY